MTDFSGSLVILDADGVFLDERPYWEAALQTALSVHQIPLPDSLGWEELSRLAFEDFALQRVTKFRGCNSNWDLAVVLNEALARVGCAEKFARFLSGQKWKCAVELLYGAAYEMWRGEMGCADAIASNCGDPIEGFGLKRNSSEFLLVKERYQQILRKMSDRGECTSGFLGDVECVRRTFAALVNAECRLAVCTGRPRAELIAPLRANDLEEFFDQRRVITADDVANSQASIGASSLAKPHWFPVAYAALGKAGAERMLTGESRAEANSNALVYVGDGMADFLSVRRAREKGIPIQYVHIRSGVTSRQDEARITETDFTLKIIDDLKELPSVLEFVESDMPW